MKSQAGKVSSIFGYGCTIAAVAGNKSNNNPISNRKDFMQSYFEKEAVPLQNMKRKMLMPNVRRMVSNIEREAFNCLT
jgi:hypothetical protein